MTSARRQPALQVFHDPVTSADRQHSVAAYERFPDMYEPGPRTDAPADYSYTYLEPPHAVSHPASPQKARRPSSSPPPRALAEKGLNPVVIPHPQEQAFSTDAPPKRLQRPIAKQTQMMAGTRPPLFTNFVAQFDKENMVAASLPPLPTKPHTGFPVAAAPPKLETKRPLPDAPPLRDRSKKGKPAREPRPAEHEDGPLPAPEDMPPIEDDSEMTKPPYSYAQLIGMAILRAPHRRLTLAQIYKWISDTFVFYRGMQETGWQNSIRHNLSLCKAFSKQERPKDDPGKGHYWRINAGFEMQYFRIKSARRPTNPDGFLPALPSDIARPTSSASANGSSFASHQGVVKSIDSSKFPEPDELASDATIPCSDPAAHDGFAPERTKPPPRQMASSPPPADIQSSPPPSARSVREDTPPRPRRPERWISKSRSGGGRKRKFDAGDSGFYSSIESSATKGGPLASLATSDAEDRPNIKPGRAEEEIARIRGSSYDSPSKTRPFMQQPSISGLVSSPFRHIGGNRDGPLTPSIIFKRPVLPPASASPNTNLRNHRNTIKALLGGSPDKNMQTLGTSAFEMWSPAVNYARTPIPNDENANLIEQGFESTFDIFRDYHYQNSPLRPSAKRPRLERAATSTNILAGITGNMAAPAPPNWRSSFPSSPRRQRSPLKAPTSNPLEDFALPRGNTVHGIPSKSASEPPYDDDFSALLHSDDSEPGIDLTQGFQKIGARAHVAPNGSPTKMAPPRGGHRPALARSSSLRF